MIWAEEGSDWLPVYLNPCAQRNISLRCDSVGCRGQSRKSEKSTFILRAVASVSLVWKDFNSHPVVVRSPSSTISILTTELTQSIRLPDCLMVASPHEIISPTQSRTMKGKTVMELFRPQGPDPHISCTSRICTHYKGRSHDFRSWNTDQGNMHEKSFSMYTQGHEFAPTV